MAAEGKLLPQRETLPGVAPGRDALGIERVVQIQRARILSAMAEACVERGTSNVTVAHVVERSGVSRRTFYELFEDREACFLVAFDEGLVRASGYVKEGYDPDARWVERIRAALTGFLSFLDLEPDVGWLLVVGSLGAGADSLERRRHVLDQVIAAVDEGRHEKRAGSGLPALTAEGVVGGVLSILHARLLQESAGHLLELTGPLMGAIVLPYLGPAAARRELEYPAPAPRVRSKPSFADPLRDLNMRLTYRTVRVLMAVAANPGSSNRQVGVASGMQDQGQISKLLSRLHRLGLIRNTGVGRTKGAPNSWMLTRKGEDIEQTIGVGRTR